MKLPVSIPRLLSLRSPFWVTALLQLCKKKPFIPTESITVKLPLLPLRLLSWCRRFQCNLCGMVCECPPEYFCATDGQGKRLDHNQRPELSQGSVEFVAPQEYMVQQLLLLAPLLLLTLLLLLLLLPLLLLLLSNLLKLSVLHSKPEAAVAEIRVCGAVCFR